EPNPHDPEKVDRIVPEFVKDLAPTRRIYEAVHAADDEPKAQALYPVRKLSADEQAHIRSATDSVRNLALMFQCSFNQVRALRQRRNARVVECGIDTAAA